MHKKLYLIVFLIVFLFSIKNTFNSPINNNEKIYDIAIVGAGMAGLSAAINLNEKNINDIIIIEKLDRIGGRVYSKNYKDINFEIGGSIGFPEELIKENNLEIKDEYYHQKPIFGYVYNNKLTWGNSILNSIENNKEIKSATINNLSELIQKYSFNYKHRTLISPNDYKPIYIQNKNYLELDNIDFYNYLKKKYNQETIEIFDTFYSTIYTQSIKNYSTISGFYLLIDMTPAFTIKGHSYYINKLKEKIKGEILFNSEVNSVIDNKEYAIIKYINNNKNEEIKAKKVIVTTPAYVTNQIIKELPEWKKDALGNLVYGSAIVINLILKSSNLPDFSYIILKDKLINYILNITPKNNNNCTVLTLYLEDKSYDLLKEKNNNEVMKIIIEEIKNIIPDINKTNIEYYDFFRWHSGFPITSIGFYTKLQPLLAKKTGNIYYAGDYTEMMLGIISAINSGKKAAEDCYNDLKELPIK